MDSGQIEALLTRHFGDSEVSVEGGDGKYQLRIVSESFAGLNQVKRQQSVYKLLNEHISSGAIHAVQMNLKTNAES